MNLKARVLFFPLEKLTDIFEGGYVFFAPSTISSSVHDFLERCDTYGGDSFITHSNQDVFIYKIPDEKFVGLNYVDINSNFLKEYRDASTFIKKNENAQIWFFGSSKNLKSLRRLLSAEIETEYIEPLTILSEDGGYCIFGINFKEGCFGISTIPIGIVFNN